MNNNLLQQANNNHILFFLNIQINFYDVFGLLNFGYIYFLISYQYLSNMLKSLLKERLEKYERWNWISSFAN